MKLSNLTPYSASRLDIFATKLLEISKTSSRDYLLIEPYSIGDCVHTLSLISEFRKKHCSNGERVNLICNQRSLPLVKLFGNIDYAVGANLGPHEYQLEALADRYGPIPIGRPILMPPDMYARGWLGSLCAAGLIHALDAKKLILEIDLETIPDVPNLDPNLQGQMEEKAKSMGLCKDSIIIFNHANTMREIDENIFRPIEKLWADRVFYDATLDNKGAISWAKPIRMNIGEIPYFVNFAGTAICIRSGITDVLSCTSANVITIYPNQNMLFDWSGDKTKVMKGFKNLTLSNLGIGSRSKEFPIFCDNIDNTESILKKLDDLLKKEKFF